LVLIFLVGLVYFVFARPALDVYSKAVVLKDDVSMLGEAFKNRDLVVLNEVLIKVKRYK